MMECVGSSGWRGDPLNVQEKDLAAGRDSASQMTWTVSPALLQSQTDLHSQFRERKR